MNKKEILIRLFKERVAILATSVFSKVTINTLNYGSDFSYEHSNTFHIHVISIAHCRIEFDGTYEELTLEEYKELERFWEEESLKQKKKKEDLIKQKAKQTLNNLAEIASNLNYNQSRRVLTEKKTINDGLKF